jgi:formylglycine-generating enzyme required for sulfatase activity
MPDYRRLLFSCLLVVAVPLALIIASASAEGAGGADMVEVGAGPFWMGCGSDDKRCAPDEEPALSVTLAAFSIDRTEVSVTAYKACVDAGACKAPRSSGERDNWDAAGRELHPVNAVTWLQANAYCKWAGKRLPTEAEWEKAARGGSDQRTYPWNTPTADCATLHRKGCNDDQLSLSVEGKPTDVSPYGALNMSGNVREWVADWYAPEHDSAATSDPKGPASGEKRVIKGSSFFKDAKAARISARGMAGEKVANFDVGFRCAK